MSGAQSCLRPSRLRIFCLCFSFTLSGSREKAAFGHVQCESKPWQEKPAAPVDSRYTSRLLLSVHTVITHGPRVVVRQLESWHASAYSMRSCGRQPRSYEAWHTPARTRGQPNFTCHYTRARHDSLLLSSSPNEAHATDGNSREPPQTTPFLPNLTLCESVPDLLLKLMDR